MTSDPNHTYTYDAEGNVTKLDGGATATYTYDALNRRVRIDGTGDPEEFVFNPAGQHTSSFDPGKFEDEGWAYWGDTPLAFYAYGTTSFEHQDWLGTERRRTDVAGNTSGSFVSLPFGDGYTVSGNDWDAAHFAGLDQDTTSNEGAQFREYSNMAGRWMSPDPYDGSYDVTNPQSLNRYSYTSNGPLSFTDPLGLYSPPFSTSRFSDLSPLKLKEQSLNVYFYDQSQFTFGSNWNEFGGTWTWMYGKEVPYGPYQPAHWEFQPYSTIWDLGPLAQNTPPPNAPNNPPCSSANCHRPSRKPVVVPHTIQTDPFCRQAYNNWQNMGNAAEWDGLIAGVGTWTAPPVSAVFGVAAAFEGTASAIDHLLYSGFCSR